MMKWLMVLLILTSCGAPAVSQQDAQATAFARIDAGLISGAPTSPPLVPTPNAAEAAQLKLMAERLMLMRQAAQELQDINTITGSNFRSKVLAQIDVFTAVKGMIDKIEIPQRYQTLRLNEVLDQCMKMAGKIDRPDIMQSDLIDIEGLDTCISGLREVELVYAKHA